MFLYLTTISNKFLTRPHVRRRQWHVKFTKYFYVTSLIYAAISIFITLFTCFSVSGQTQNPDSLQCNGDFHNWSKTPPMGWNSWDSYGPTVKEDEVKANADYMVKYLKQYGWNYIVVDIRWYVSNDKSHGYNQVDPQYNLDKYGRFIPSVNRFPSAADGKGFKPLADYLHQCGLKFGIHILRGVPIAAVEKKLPVKGTNVSAEDIYSKKELCKWVSDMYTVDASKKGAQEYYNSLFELYASWGVDLVKVDDLSQPYHRDEIEMIRKAIDSCGRKIVLSTSPGETPIEDAAHVQQNANMWRVIDDFWDDWQPLKAHFEIFDRWNKWRIKGAWPDGDMLPLGRLAIRAERGNARMTKFTKNEQYTLMTLWCIFKSPLMFGGNLPDNDAFTLSLLTNKDVLEVLNTSIHNRPLYDHDQDAVWVADAPGSKAEYIAIFNKSEEYSVIKIDLKQLGFSSAVNVKDLWSGKNLEDITSALNIKVPKHGARLLLVSPR